MSDVIRTRIHMLDPDSGHPIVLVPLTDGIGAPTFTNQSTEQIKATLVSLLNSGNYAVVEKTTHDALMNLGLSPYWRPDKRANKPIVWNQATSRWVYVARLVADCRYDETVTTINGNVWDLRYRNLEKKRKHMKPERRDREDVVRPEQAEPIKDMVTYQEYAMPTYQYN